jgi:transaldolase
MSYRLFIDSADATEWSVGRDRGWLHGVTTNPLVIARGGKPVDLTTASGLVGEARDAGLAEIQLQATGLDAAGLLSNGRALRNLWHGVSVKVPATATGFEAASALCRDGVPVTITACYTAHQTMLAAAIGAAYVAPYYGRMLDAGIDADGRLDAMQSIAARQGNLRVLVASIRSLDQLETLVTRGFDTFTVTPALAARIGCDPNSDVAAADFMAAAEKSRK